MTELHTWTRSLFGDVKGNAIGVDDAMIHTFPIVVFFVFLSTHTEETLLEYLPTGSDRTRDVEFSLP
jgi:hypothetical protein